MVDTLDNREEFTYIHQLSIKVDFSVADLNAFKHGTTNDDQDAHPKLFFKRQEH